MTDEKEVRPTDLGPAQPDTSNRMDPEPRRFCLACGGHHGSVGGAILCLENEIVELRARERVWLADPIHAIRRENDERNKSGKGWKPY